MWAFFLRFSYSANFLKNRMMPSFKLLAQAISSELSEVVADKAQATEIADNASLAQQENLEIRGNDARHMLMHKLMRVNRSSVIVLRNMVTVDEMDDELEDEIREECAKYGKVEEVCRKLVLIFFPSFESLVPSSLPNQPLPARIFYFFNCLSR